MTSTATGMPRGRLATPKTIRTEVLSSPKTSRNSSEAASATLVDRRSLHTLQDRCIVEQRGLPYRASLASALPLTNIQGGDAGKNWMRTQVERRRTSARVRWLEAYR